MSEHTGQTADRQACEGATDGGTSDDLASDVRERIERQERGLRRETARRLVASAGDPMYVADADGRIRLCNEAMERLFYAGEAALSGTALADLFPGEEAERVRAAAETARETGDATTCAVSLPNGTDRERRFEVTVTTFHEPDPGTAGHDSGTAVGDRGGVDRDPVGREPTAWARPDEYWSVGVVHEVTERERREQDLETLTQLLGRVLRHDVRTGLTVVRGQAEVLAERLDGENQDLAETILDRSEQLVETTEKARAVERVVDSADERTTMDLRTVVNRAVADVAATHPDAAYDATIVEQVPVDVHPEFPRAVENLLENAVEHSSTSPDSQARRDAGSASASEPSVADAPEDAVEHSSTSAGDGPRVTVSATVGAETVALHVADDGPGIAAEELEVLEERTERPLKHGSGVGLWLVDWVVDRSNGRLEFDTGSDGTTVTVRVPRADPAELGRGHRPSSE